jgi:hypothetical protein
MWKTKDRELISYDALHNSGKGGEIDGMEEMLSGCDSGSTGISFGPRLPCLALV